MRFDGQSEIKIIFINFSVNESQLTVLAQTLRVKPKLKNKKQAIRKINLNFPIEPKNLNTVEIFRHL